MSVNNGHIDGVMAALSYSTIAGTKRDVVTTAEVLEQKHASEDSGKWSNTLFPPSICGKKNCFTELRKHLSQMRSIHYSNTYQYEDQIWRILPQKRVEFYKEFVEKDGKAKALELLEAFIAGLPELKDMARLARAEAYREEDYPTEATIRAMFKYSVSYRPIPNTSGLNPQLFADAIQEIEQMHAKKVEEANIALVQRFMAPFQTLKEQLENPEGRKLQPVMASIVQVTGMVESMDLSGNQELIASAKQMHDLFSQLQPEMVRKDEEVRKMLGTTCGNVLSSLERFGAVGNRKFA
jgi:hypothetical protein